jgi:hypothetical protein
MMTENELEIDLESFKDQSAEMRAKIEALVSQSKDPDLLKAELIIAQIRLRAELEASVGRNFAIVMSFSEDEIERGDQGYIVFDRCEPDWLLGAPLFVFAFCSQQRLNPTIEYWRHADNHVEGFNIVIHW